MYTLTEEARERLIKYEEETQDIGSKVCKHALKLEVNFHVLFHQLQQVLAFADNPTPLVIEQSTVDRALSFMDVATRNSKKKIA